MSDMPMQKPETPPSQETHWLTRQHVLAILLVVLTVAAFVLCYMMLKPFLAPIAWALALAIVAHPLHTWIKTRVTNPTAAAVIAVVVVTIILLIPVVFVGYQLLREAMNHFDLIASPDQPAVWRDALEKSSIGDTFLWLDERIDFTGQINQVVDGLAGQATDALRQSIWLIVQLLVTMFTLFFLLRDWHQARAAARSLVPLSPAESDDVFRLVGDTIHATIYGSVMMAVIQGALGGFIFWALGIPSPLLWGVVMAVLATVPNLGAFIVWAPAAIGLGLQGEWGKAAILTAWGLIAIGLIDNLLYPYIVGSRMRMHTVAVFFAILGGMIVFGPAGLILGPVVFALTHAVIEIWRRRTANGNAAENGAGAPVCQIEERCI